jgi:hypothetical protein
VVAGRGLQGAGEGVLIEAFDGVKRRHEAADAASYNDDPTHKARLNEARTARGKKSWRWGRRLVLDGAGVEGALKGRKILMAKLAPRLCKALLVLDKRHPHKHNIARGLNCGADPGRQGWRCGQAEARHQPPVGPRPPPHFPTHMHIPIRSYSGNVRR